MDVVGAGGVGGRKVTGGKYTAVDWIARYVDESIRSIRNGSSCGEGW